MTLERTQAALATNQRHGAALAYGATALAVLGERERAHEWVSRAMLLDPDNHAMRYNLVCALATDLGEIDTAIELIGAIPGGRDGAASSPTPRSIRISIG